MSDKKLKVIKKIDTEKTDKIQERLEIGLLKIYIRKYPREAQRILNISCKNLLNNIN